MANKEQKRSSREAKKPKQKKKGAEKRAAAKTQTTKTLEWFAPSGRKFLRRPALTANVPAYKRP